MTKIVQILMASLPLALRQRGAKTRIASRGNAGFSLTEISIVLVVIGLITGGIVAGQSLIETMQYRKTIAIVRDIGLAIKAFEMKYDCIPGDCKFSDFFPTAFDGNENGVIEVLGNEVPPACLHLELAELLPSGLECNSGSVWGFKEGKIQSIKRGTSFTETWVTDSSLAALPEELSSYGPVVYFYIVGSATGLQLSEMAELDRRYDDGNGQTGMIRSTCVDGSGDYLTAFPFICNYMISTAI